VRRKFISKNCLRYRDSLWNCLWTWKGSPIGGGII
jgi:hypothetical protein